MTQAVDWFMINAMREEETNDKISDNPFLRFYPRIFDAISMADSSDTHRGADAIGSTLPHDRDCRMLSEEELMVGFR